MYALRTRVGYETKKKMIWKSNCKKREELAKEKPRNGMPTWIMSTSCMPFISAKRLQHVSIRHHEPYSSGFGCDRLWHYLPENILNSSTLTHSNFPSTYCLYTYIMKLKPYVSVHFIHAIMVQFRRWILVFLFLFCEHRLFLPGSGECPKHFSDRQTTQTTQTMCSESYQTTAFSFSLFLYLLSAEKYHEITFIFHSVRWWEKKTSTHTTSIFVCCSGSKYATNELA